MDKNELEMFAFDVLGDLIPIESYSIFLLPNKDAAILVNKTKIGIPIEMVASEWNNSKKGIEFEKVKIFSC